MPPVPDRARAPSASDRVVAGLAWGVFLLPSAWLLLFGALVLRARLALGFWPYPARGNPFLGTLEYSIDPKEFPVHHVLVWWGLAPTFFVLVCTPLLVLVGMGLRVLRPRPYWGTLWLAQATVWYYLIVVGAWGLFDWFWD